VHGPAGEACSLEHAQPLGTLAGEDLSALLARRPIFVSAAKYEPFGLAVLEAAQAGCALVLADRPGFRELWNEAAVFVDPADPVSIAAAVDRLIAAPADREALGQAARRRSAEFAPEAMADAMLGLYGTLAAAPQKAAA
jgi:glycosyltransferase involved in cell wall biosynthesis